MKGVLQTPSAQAPPWKHSPLPSLNRLNVSFLVCKGARKVTIIIGVITGLQKDAHRPANSSPIQILVINVPWEYGIMGITVGLINRSHVSAPLAEFTAS